MLHCQPVHKRDLRKLDEAFAASNETSIVVRQQAIVINAGADGMSDRSYILMPHNL